MRTLLSLIFVALLQISAAAQAQYSIDWADEAIYFVIPDRFNNGDPSNDYAGDKGDELDDILRHGYNPKHKGYYHGGDIKGLTQKLDYIQNMGITAIWVSPIFKNNPVQRLPGMDDSSSENILNLSDSGYHGYWITDFTQIDPHLGTNDELKTFINEAHKRGMKVYFDIIVNHTADIIQQKECPLGCLYQSVSKFPYSTKGKRDGKVINRGFVDGVWTEDNFAKLKNPDWAFENYIPEGKENVKIPAWLNDMTLYHNRGNTSFSGKEDSELGDFKGLDDLFTEHESVVEGMVDIYKFWIREFDIDGFRLDTYKHVNQSFWRKFIPQITDYAASLGKPNFLAFAEVWFFDAERLSYYTKATPAASSLDFAFQRSALETFVKGDGTEKFRRLFLQDDFYNGGASTERVLPTFLGNHDMGRIAYFLKGEQPLEDEAQHLKRIQLAHAFMITSRGIPVVYYGDEQGFTGDGGDKDSREDMFPSLVPSYNDNNLVGTDKTTADDNFDESHPIYTTIKTMLAIRKEHKALRRGVLIHRDSSRDAGIMAFSRIDPEERVEYIVAFNTAAEGKDAQVAAMNPSTSYMAVYPTTAAELTTDSEGNVVVPVPAMDFVIYKASKTIPVLAKAPEVKINLDEGERISGYIEICGLVAENTLAKADFYVKYPSSKDWEHVGTDFSPSPVDPNVDVNGCGGEGYAYRTMLLGDYSSKYNDRTMPNNLPLEVKVVLDDYNNHQSVAESNVIFDNNFRKLVIHYENGNNRSTAFGIAKDMPFMFPNALKENTTELFWPGDSKYVYLYFDTFTKDNVAIDAPIRLQFGKHFLSNFKDVKGSKGYAEIWINNKHQVSGENNFLNDDTKPGIAYESKPGMKAPFGDTAVYLRGDMNDWKATDQMAYNANTGVYSATVTVQPGDTNFRIADKDWSDKVNFGGPYLKKSGLYVGDGSSTLPVSIPYGKGDKYTFALINGKHKGKPYRIYRVAAEK